MGLMGFPSDKDMSEMFGFVTEEDREKWDKDRKAKAAKGSDGTAKDLASKSIAPSLDMARHGIQAQLHGAQNDSQRGTQAKQRQRVVTRETVTESSRNIDDSGYEPEF